MKIEKYQACGNDFIVINNKENVDVKRLCSYHYSFGADGLIYVDEKNLNVEFFNADGSFASICGNGLRCVGLYLKRKGILKDTINVCVNNKKYLLTLVRNQIKVNFPLEDINYELINLFFENVNYDIYKIDVGNKHLVINSKVNKSLIKYLKVRYKGYNINFVRIINRNNIKVITYENGVGFTLSCGSGSLASCIVLADLNQINKEVFIKVNEGKLKVSLSSSYSLIGTVSFVYQGENDE